MRVQKNAIRKCKNRIFLILFLWGTNHLSAQEIWRHNYLDFNGGTSIYTQPFTGFTIRLAKGQELPSINGENKPIALDDHVVSDDFDQSILYLINDSVLHISNCLHLNFEVIFQNVPPFVSSAPARALRRNPCGQPAMVSQEVWRAGLADPKPNPNSTAMRHCIVHHSAGGNGSTKYTDLVRSYYVQHTQVNGWDDIGYNFLVAYDGTIFLGRDKQNLMVSQYQVQGAHFCAKNAGTAGICLIGNYNEIEPSDTMMRALEETLSWIFFNEQRNAQDSSPHPTPTDSDLDHIAGHRQGCATACPGDSVFRVLDSVRVRTERRRKECDQIVGIPRPISQQKKHDIKYRIKNGKLTVLSQFDWYIYSINGTLLHTGNANQKKTSLKLSAGVYIIKTPRGTEKLWVP